MEDHRRNGHDAKEAAAKGIPADAHECDTPELGPGAPEHELRISPTAVRIACIVAVLITAVVAAASFVLSFASLADLAQRSGYPAELAKLWPVIVDLTIVLATVAVIILGPAGVGSRAHRRYFWAALAISAIISVGGNALHGYLPPDTALWPWLAACIAAVAPLSLLATVHGAATMLRISAFVSRRTPAADASADTPTAEAPVAEAHDTPVSIKNASLSIIRSTVRLRTRVRSGAAYARGGRGSLGPGAAPRRPGVVGARNSRLRAVAIQSRMVGSGRSNIVERRPIAPRPRAASPMLSVTEYGVCKAVTHVPLVPENARG